MPVAGDTSVKLPAEVAERALLLAREQRCSVGELFGEALRRYEAMERLTSGSASNQERTDALDDLVMDYVNRVIHEDRSERRAEEAAKQSGGRKAS